MKRVYANEKWCLGCHLCEYNCAFANSGQSDMVKALKDKCIGCLTCILVCSYGVDMLKKIRHLRCFFLKSVEKKLGGVI